jgi:hypothetical protein
MNEEHSLRELQQQAVQSALKSGRIEDLEKAANITKQAIDAQKAVTDNKNQPKLVRYEGFKTWAALIVPLLSIGTLLVTIYIQAGLLKATTEANEDTQWRETVKNVLSQLDKKPSSVADPALAMSLLEPYSSDSRFGRDATLLAVQLLSRVPSSDRFKEYFLSHHVGETQSDISFLTTVNRELFNDFADLDHRLKQPLEPREKLTVMQMRDTFVDDIEFITERLCTLYRAQHTTTALTDLRDVFLMNGDLSGVNLTGADLSGSKFETTNFANANLIGNIKFMDTSFVDSNWWDAREIAKPLLKYLIEEQYPYFDSEGVIYFVPPPNKQQYFEKVRQLCQKVGLACEPESLKYGTPPPKKAEPKKKQLIHSPQSGRPHSPLLRTEALAQEGLRTASFPLPTRRTPCKTGIYTTRPLTVMKSKLRVVP